MLCRTFYHRFGGGTSEFLKQFFECYAQGYYFSRPVETSIYEEMLIKYQEEKNEIETPGIVWKKLDPAVSIDTTKKTTIFVVE